MRHHRAHLLLLMLLCFTSSLVTTQMVIGAGRQYEVILTASSVDFINPHYLGRDAYMRVSRKTRKSAPTLDGFMPILVDVPLNTNNTWTAYQKMNNQWKESFINGHMPLCTVLDGDVKMYRVFLDYWNLPKKCPVPKRNYTIADFKFDTKYLPPVAPPGNEWRFKSGWIVGDTVMFSYWIEIKIDRSREARSKKTAEH